MELRFCGTEWYPRTEGTVSLLVDSGDERLLVDCPPNVTMALDDLGVAPASVDTLLLTHSHVDHVLGAPYLLAARFFESAGTIREGPTEPSPIRVLVEASTRPRLDELLAGASVDLDETLGSDGYAIETATPDDEYAVGEVTADLVAAAHSVPTLGVAFRGDRTVGYTCDTTYSAALVETLGPCDELIAEAAFTSDSADLAAELGHATAAEAGRMAHDVGADRLHLVHLSDTGAPEQARAEAADEFDGEVTLPSAGARVSFG